MRNSVLCALVFLLGLALAGCSIGAGQVRGSGNITTETRKVAGFTAVDVSGVGDVIITQGDAESLTVETDDNIQRLVLSEVRGDTLYLSMEPNTSLARIPRLIFTVTVRDLTQLTLAGAATISVRDLSGDQLRVDHSGVGLLTLAGAVNAQDVTLSGVGGYDGAALMSDRATVTVSGVGNVVVNVGERLDATVSGMGSIAYIGSPEVHQQIDGLGTIRQRAP